MFANRFAAFVDACSLAGALKRNLLCTLAEAEFFRIRWSQPVLAETEAAIEGILQSRGIENARDRASRARSFMEAAFPEAIVGDFDHLIGAGEGLPDSEDRHVVAAALKAQAATIVTDNLKDFPDAVLTPLGLQARSTDDFIADTVALDAPRAVVAIRRMRQRLRRPEKTPELLLIDIEAAGLTETADLLRAHLDSL